MSRSSINLRFRRLFIGTDFSCPILWMVFLCDAESIAPGESVLGVIFPLGKSRQLLGHSHYDLQEQLFNSAPLIIWTPEEKAKAKHQAIVMLSDFSFTPRSRS